MPRGRPRALGAAALLSLLLLLIGFFLFRGHPECERCDLGGEGVLRDPCPVR